MLLSHDQILKLLDAGVVEGADPANVNSASLDVTLGDRIVVENKAEEYLHYIDLRKRMPLSGSEVIIDEFKGYMLAPKEFILAHTKERFNLPLNISAEYKLKSSMARIGLEHLNAGWCDAGWHGSALTLELVNITQRHIIRIRPGDKIGQVVFFTHQQVKAKDSYLYRGRYNNDAQVQGIKP